MYFQSIEAGGQCISANLVDSKCLIIAFTSLDINSEKPDKFDFASLANVDHISSILIRDIHHSWYHGPILAADWGTEALSNWLINIANDYENVICVGSSMGGYAAILFGALIRAQCVISFCPQTSIDPGEARRIGDDRYLRQLDDISLSCTDRSKFFLANLRLAPTTIYAGRRDPIDCVHAASLRQNPMVTIYEIDHLGHNMVEPLKAFGLLRMIIASACERLRPPDVRRDIYNRIARRSGALEVVDVRDDQAAGIVHVMAKNRLADINLTVAYELKRVGSDQVLRSDYLAPCEGGSAKSSIPYGDMGAGEYEVQLQLFERGMRFDRLGISPTCINVRA